MLTINVGDPLERRDLSEPAVFGLPITNPADGEPVQTQKKEISKERKKEKKERKRIE